MNRIAAALAILGLAAPSIALAKPAPASKPAPVKVAKISNPQRINEAVKFASKKSAFSGDPGAVLTGWDAGQSKLPVVAKTGSVRLSSGDEQANQFANYLVTFAKKGKSVNKPSKLVFINNYE